jgi:chitinase
MESNATSMLQGAVNAGVKVNLVNIMIMDFGDGQNPLTDGESAAKASVPQLESIFGVSSTQAWNMLGLTPIAGQNDDAENFTQSDATSLESFAAQHGVQELAFWEVDQYDKPLNYAYSATFTKITGGGSTGSPSPSPSPSSGGGGGGAGTITGNNSGLCLGVTQDSNALKTTADIATCNGYTDQQWTVNSNGTLENADNLCLSVSGGSTTPKATADVYTCNGSAPENWTVNSNGTITNNNSGLCLSVSGGSTTPGATADIYTCNGSASENWTVN